LPFSTCWLAACPRPYFHLLVGRLPAAIFHLLAGRLPAILHLLVARLPAAVFHLLAVTERQMADLARLAPARSPNCQLLTNDGEAEGPNGTDSPS
jgi:hypothetical protein